MAPRPGKSPRQILLEKFTNSVVGLQDVLADESIVDALRVAALSDTGTAIIPNAILEDYVNFAEFIRRNPTRLHAPGGAPALIVPGFLGSTLTDKKGKHGLIWINPGLLKDGTPLQALRLDPWPDVVAGLYWGLLFANIFVVLLGLVILNPAIWLVNRPKPYLIAAILALVVSGVFAIDQSVFDVGLVLGFGVLGYVLRRLGVPMLPLVLGVVLGFMLESNFRRSLVLSDGDLLIFVQDPVSLTLLVLAAVLTAYSVWRELRPASKET